LGIGDLRLGRGEGDWIIGRVLNKEGRKGKGGLEIGDWRLEIGDWRLGRGIDDW
jgi:hypothetical protein